MAKRKRTSSRSRKKKSGFFHLSFRVLLIICASALIIGYLSAFISPETFFPPTVFGLYFIPLAILNFTLLIVAIFRKSGSFWIPFLALIPSLFILEFLYQPSRDDVPWQKDELKIMTYNVGLFRSGKNRMDDDDAREAIMKFIDKSAPDIVCLQEYSIRDTLSIKRQFSNYPHITYHLFKHTDGRWTGNITASKYPIKATGTVEFKGSTNMSLWSDILYQDRQYRIFNNHLESNAISLTSFIKKIGNRDADIKPELEKIHGKLKTSVSRRTHQTTEILNNINSCRKPSVICGDFNDMPLSYTFRHLYKGRKDSFVEGGKGFGATYSILWPLLRIDYILLPEQMNVLEHESPRNTYSDHYPVITRITLSNEKDK